MRASTSARVCEIYVTYAADMGQKAFPFNYKHFHAALFDVLVGCRR